MATVVTLEEAQSKLRELIDRLDAGGEILITRDEKPVARLIAAQPTGRKTRRPGTLKGSVLYMAPDFNAPLEDFEEYMG